eukprot:3830181-Pyramimonas_sp.AAC.1
MAGHFARIVSRCDTLAKRAVFRPAPGPDAIEAARAYGRELANFMIDSIHVSSLELATGAKRKAKLEREIRHCFETVLLGPLWRKDRQIVLWDTGSVGSAEVRDKVREVLVNVIFPRMPIEPVAEKWTKLMPCLSFFIAANSFGILAALVDLAAFKFDVSLDDGRQGGISGEAHVDELQWGVLAGSRLRRTQRLLGNAVQRFHQHVLGVVLEPLQVLHDFFLNLAHGAIDCSRPSARRRRRRSRGEDED